MPKTSATRKNLPKPSRCGDRHTHPQLAIRVPADELDAWRDSAAAAGLTLTDWLRVAANERASR
jgi:uncharacterized protein (DUF1778 family)